LKARHISVFFADFLYFLINITYVGGELRANKLVLDSIEDTIILLFVSELCIWNIKRGNSFDSAKALRTS
jgi:hypothetical protein